MLGVSASGFEALELFATGTFTNWRKAGVSACRFETLHQINSISMLTDGKMPDRLLADLKRIELARDGANAIKAKCQGFCLQICN
jgi:hypothetical protein